MPHHRSLAEFRIKNATLRFHTLFFPFLASYNLRLIIFVSFFDELQKFLQQNINHSKTELGNKKLPVELSAIDEA